ncbi:MULTISPECIES: hypothetical protein [unclassified Frankia]|uniref:hypothetical protein n=1 Tax=unclassified Frankia TaxID=2632575 RepID=UPI002AD44D1C|nr:MULTISPECIES: hypothetical protein [unclassified Frankia]
MSSRNDIVRLAAAFLVLLNEGDVDDVLHAMVTPESLKTWLRELDEVRTLLAGRGLATRADYPAPDVAYVKLTLDPGETVRATATVPVAGAVILTRQRRPELPDIADVGGWRVRAVGERGHTHTHTHTHTQTLMWTGERPAGWTACRPGRGGR